MESLLSQIESVLRGNGDPVVVSAWIWGIFGTFATLSIGVLYFVELRNAYRKILFLDLFSEMEKRVLIFQLLAMVLFVVAGLVLFLHAVLSGFNLAIFDTVPGKVGILVLGWITLGSVAVTSIVFGVSIMSVRGVRAWQEERDPLMPYKGEDAVIGGILKLGLLVFLTWKFLFTP